MQFAFLPLVVLCFCVSDFLSSFHITVVSVIAHTNCRMEWEYSCIFHRRDEKYGLWKAKFSICRFLRIYQQNECNEKQRKQSSFFPLDEKIFIQLFASTCIAVKEHKRTAKKKMSMSFPLFFSVVIFFLGIWNIRRLFFVQ